MYFHFLAAHGSWYLGRVLGKSVAFLLAVLLAFQPLAVSYADEGAPASVDATSASESTPPPTPAAAESSDATVITGDATSDTTIANDVNTNTTDLASETPSEEATTANLDEPIPESTSDVSATDTPSADVSSQTNEEETLPTDAEQPAAEQTVSDTPTSDTPADTSLVVVNDNEALVENAVTSTASTGSNEVVAASGDASVQTGNAYSSVNAVNVVNSNLTGADGFFQLFNIFGNIFGDMEVSFDTGTACDFVCMFEKLYASNTNSATIINDLFAAASTGSNVADGSGNTSIQTGDAYAAANLVNVVNTNIVSSDYLSFILNAFGSWQGDLVLPPAALFENAPCSDPCADESQNVTSKNISNASIENQTNVSADTGSNMASSTGAVIETGNAVAATNVMTIANTSILGSNFLLVYVRTLGEWSGRVFSLPQGVSLIKVQGGFLIDGFSQGMNAGSESVSSSGAGVSGTSVSNGNTAIIRNRVGASAFTGSNSVSSSGGSASISSGNAYAAANVLNIVNTNILGRNWLMAVVNIFGDWHGDLAFGRPDLWLGSSAEGPSPLTPGSRITHKLTYRNNGNAPATDVLVQGVFEDALNIVDARGGEVDPVNHTVSWKIAKLIPGESGSFSYTAELGNNIANGSSRLAASANVASYEDDGKPADNSDILSFEAYKAVPDSGWGGYNSWPRLEIRKELRGPAEVQAGSTVTYEIHVVNRGSAAAPDVVVHDVMKNSKGEAVDAREWGLGPVEANEEVLIEYTVAFASSTVPGVYTNTALASWERTVSSSADNSGDSSANITVLAPKDVPSAEPVANMNSDASSGSASPTPVAPEPPAGTPVPAAEKPAHDISTTGSSTTRAILSGAVLDAWGALPGPDTFPPPNAALGEKVSDITSGAAVSDVSHTPASTFLLASLFSLPLRYWLFMLAPLLTFGLFVLFKRRRDLGLAALKVRFMHFFF